MGRGISSHVSTSHRAPPSGRISCEKSCFLQYVTRKPLFFSAFAVSFAVFAFRTKKRPLKSHRVRSNFSSALDATNITAEMALCTSWMPEPGAGSGEATEVHEVHCAGFAERKNFASIENNFAFSLVVQKIVVSLQCLNKTRNNEYEKRNNGSDSRGKGVYRSSQKLQPLIPERIPRTSVGDRANAGRYDKTAVLLTDQASPHWGGAHKKDYEPI